MVLTREDFQLKCKSIRKVLFLFYVQVLLYLKRTHLKIKYISLMKVIPY